MLKNMSNDHALGTEKCPADVESALQMMLLHSEGVSKNLAEKKQQKQLEDESPQLGFVQLSENKMRQEGLCFKCKKCGHTTDKCPNKGTSDNNGNGTMQLVQTNDDEQVHSWTNN